MHTNIVQTVHLFLPKGLADWETGFAVANIGNSDFQKHPGRYRVQTVAESMSPITTMGGLRVLPDLTIAELSPENSAMLILPGSAGWERGENTEAVAIAGSFLAARVPVAAICGATFALAKAGLFDTRRHTSSAREYLAATGYHGGHLYVDAPTVVDGELITAPPTQPIAFARAIFEKLDLFTKEVLDAWFGLFSTGEARYFYALMQALTPKQTE